MTIRVMSAGRGFEYLLKSVAAGDGDRDLGTPLTRYYAEVGNPPGRWVGSGLSGLGSTETGQVTAGDEVTEEHLERLLGAGADPITGTKLGASYPVLQSAAQRIAARVARLDAGLGEHEHAQRVANITEEERARGRRNPVAGFDLTFSPPKSFSALWGVADAGSQLLLAQAHHAAMYDTIALLEERVIATRVGHGGIARMPVRGIVATAFDHYDTRAGDPQLHTHLVVSNKVQGVDGKWRTLDSKTLHRATVALSVSYNAFLTDHTARLLGVTWEPVDRGRDRNTGWEIAGIPTTVAAAFSRRTHGIGGKDGIEQVKDQLIAEYITVHGRSPSARVLAKLRQQATLQTRPDKELRSLAELTTDWRARATAILGQDATTWARELLSHLPTDAVLRADDLPLEQVHDIAAVVLMEVGNRRATWGRYNLHAETMRQLMGIRFATSADRTAILDAIVARAEDSSVRLTPEYNRLIPERYRELDGSNWFQPSDRITYTSQAILDAESRLLRHAADTTGARLPVRLIDRHTIRPVRGVKLADDQAAAILRLATSGRVLDTLVGPAGTGKTTALRALHRAWTAVHGRDSVIGLAPSAAAADVLREELGVRTENTAKFLYEQRRGRWDLTAGQLVLLDEASLAGTLALDQITQHASSVGAKVVLIGDWAQLSAVEIGGAFGMLTRAHPDAAELTDVRRFRNAWEKTASLGLRHGDPTVLDAYRKHARIHVGELEDMLDSAYTAWQADRTAGQSSLMIAATAETVAELNQRARADLVETGTVQESGIELRDGTTAGVGDLIVTRRNDRRLSIGTGGWVKNGDRWQVSGRYEDGSLVARRIGRDDTPRGQAIVLPASYVATEVELGYATSVHRAQGSTVDTAHAVIDPATANRELLYVALTRGRHANHAYVTLGADEEAEQHHDLTPPATAQEQLTQVLAKSGADEAATETLRLAVDHHSSLDTLLNEYEHIATDAQQQRWAALIENTPLDEAMRDEIFDSRYYPTLELSLRRAESHGYNPARLLADAARALASHTPEQGKAPPDPAGALARFIDRAAATPRRSRNIPEPRRVAGLLPLPAGDMPEDMRAAIIERAQLIEQRAQRLLVADLETGAAWITHLGAPGPSTHDQAAWSRAAATIRLYRERYDITGPSPLGNPDQVKGLEQAYEYRAARAAYQHVRHLTQHNPPDTPTRDGHGIDQKRSLRR